MHGTLRALLPLVLVAGCGVPSFGFTDAGADAETDAGASPCMCTEGPPAGWQGPLVLFQGTTSPPECGGQYPVVAYNGQGDLTAAPAACQACMCSAPDGGTCSTRMFVTSDCGQSTATGCTGFTLPAGTCVSLGAPNGCQGRGAGYGPSTTSGEAGNCVASGGAQTGAPAAFGTLARACALATSAPTSSCAASQVCAAPPPAGFGPGLCIEASGDVPCPSASPYAVQLLFYASFADARTCSDCGCTPPSCAGLIDLFPGTSASPGSCAGTPAGLGIGAGRCAVPASAPVAARFVTSSDKCTPSGGVPGGTVMAVSPTTFCCMP